MVTAVISDLHLGTRTKGDLLRRAEIRRRLMAELQVVDQVVLLGDSVELRDGLLAAALEAAAPFFEDLGQALAGRRVTLVAGNHDHQLAVPWLTRHRANGGALGLEHVSCSRPGDPLAYLAGRMPATELVLAYPGVWVRPDIYATHGHYLDCHNQVATFECLARAVSERLGRSPPHGYRAPDDYEAVLAPVYRAIHRVTQSTRTRRMARAGKMAVRAFERAGGYRGVQGPLSRTAGRSLVRAALETLDRLGLGSFADEPSRAGARRPGLGAMAQVVDGLGIEAAYVIFGHLHRSGPVDGDGGDWRATNGTRLVNSGSWLYEPAYLDETLAQSPYWPGTCVLVGDDGPPELRHLLGGVSRAELGGGMP